ncbi:MAG TPA: Na/Pi cotransporter family protein, partial [Deltaproteobacteria bacterium]|nr:Na/Pi cotransporter family protein [Deltaproteobacteria bacterium]
MSGCITAATGLVLFLFAMVRLTATVRRTVTSIRTRELFRYAVRTPIWGVVTGILVTILFQSSSATTVLTVGLVSAGLLSFFHSLGVLLGADIGTTLTVQFVVWRVTDLSPLLLIGGALLWATGKKRLASPGEGIFYFGLMFFGLSLATQGTEFLRESPAALRFFQETSGPLAGVLIGCVFTALVQSSAVPISLLVILAGHDLVTVEAALPFVLGANLGTSATAIIAATASNSEGRRVAFSHTFFKAAGVALFLTVLSPFAAMLQTFSTSVPQQIALSHIVFNLVVAVLFLPFLPLFARFALRIIPKRGETLPLWPEFIDDRLLSDPEAALEAARKEMEREMALARRMCAIAVNLVTNFQPGPVRTIGYMESVVNSLKQEISGFLRLVSERPLSEAMSKRLFFYSSLVNDIERIADHAVNISELAELKKENRIGFSEAADQDLADILALVNTNLDDALTLMET